MPLKEIAPEVFIADSPLVKVSRQDIEFLKDKLKHCSRGRIRLCAHQENSDLLHEMFIVLCQDTYIRPHRHFNKSESFHVLEGTADVVIFDEAGSIDEVVQMGNVASGKQFFYRMS